MEDIKLTETDDIWGPLGEQWWTENGEACRATPQQVRYAAARHGGATRAKAAELAGYAGDAQALRSAGSRVDDTDTVKNLLTLAAAAAAGLTNVSPVTVREAKDKVGKLVRSHDSGIALKAAELFVKLEAAEKVAGAVDDYDRGDGLGDWRIERDWLLMPNGAVAYLLTHVDGGLMRDLGNLRLLHDTYSLLMEQHGGPELWERCYARMNDGARKHLDARLADPNWQLEVRKQIWGEIGVDITKVERPKHRAGLNGHKEIAANG
jgi:hypothetical protein